MASDAQDIALPLSLANVTIGILTALEEEYAACQDVFDPGRDRAEENRRATSGTMTCWLCRIRAHGGQHIVAISLVPDMGNNAAAIAANILLQHCPEICHLIMCGIAGAVPHPEKPEDHVRLGDIVVSSGMGVIQYDRGKQRDLRKSVPPGPNSTDRGHWIARTLHWLKSWCARQGDSFAGFEFRGPPRPPCPILLHAVKLMHAEEELLGPRDCREWDSKIREFLRRRTYPQAWRRPTPATDKLIDSPDGRGGVAHPKDSSRRSRWPRVFRGPIGAANIVLADPKKRDALRERFGIRAVEMEGSGVADVSWMTGVGYLVVRGTCDYCNSTKGEVWHIMLH